MGGGRRRPWSYWDRWYCVVCVADFAGDWDALAERLAGRSGRLHIASDAESKLSHLDDLVGRLRAAGLTSTDLAGDVDAYGADQGAVQGARSGPVGA